MAAVYYDKPYLLLDGGSHKDPSKYWYVEKYVYGTLTETVEIALGTSAAFGSVASGYDDDTFYGWSISPTSTTSTFNKTTKYSNTTATVKNNLDSENTLKIYAIYSYTSSQITYSARSAGGSYSQGSPVNSTSTIKAEANGTLSITGYNRGGSASGTFDNNITLGSTTSSSTYVQIGGRFASGTLGTNKAPVTAAVYKDETITIHASAGTSSGSGVINISVSNIPVYATAYRVISHTS